jgi:glycosyltransferase involved in cell wall biosynthesis
VRNLITQVDPLGRDSARPFFASTSVAIFVYNYSTSGVAYSGGRYHALLVAYALANAGVRVSVVTDSPLSSRADMEEHGNGVVEYIYTDKFEADQVPGTFDYVLVAPTGALYPEFYNCAERVARRSGATTVLINYESANWFNSLAPTPDYPEVWDYWRRVVIEGGLVLSSTRESDQYARDFYRSDIGELQFDYCYPPINSAVADAVGIHEKDGSIVYFARPHHDHKGGADVLGLPPQVFAGRTLRVIFGGDVVPEYCKALEARISLAEGAKLTVHSRISDHEKYVLLAQANALLFPSRFEGFGYPPVEAAYVGTEAVCYDLPVLVETVGHVAHMAPVGDIEALAGALLTALEQPNRSASLRDSVVEHVEMGHVASRLLAIFAASDADTNIHQDSDYTVLWGPWDVSEVDSQWKQGATDFAPAPPYGVATRASDGGWTTLSFVIWVKGTLATSVLRAGNRVLHVESIDHTAAIGDWTRTSVAVSLPEEAIGSMLSLSGYNSEGSQVHANYTMCVRGGGMK